MPAQSRTCRRSSSKLAWYPCIGRSASRLSRTKSGIVSSRFSAGGDITLLSLAAPIPPLRLFQRETWISRLRNGRAKNVQAANILGLSRKQAELLIKFFWILPGQLRHAADAEQFKIAEHRGSNRSQVS